jgi:hypothetical protein
VPDGTFLTDELLQHLIAAGQVDVLVAVPTYHHAATVGPVIRAVNEGLARHFPRDRTLLLHTDGGSTDGTQEIAREAARAEGELYTSKHLLRTVHRISAPYQGLPGRRNAVLTVFAAAELTQAKAVAVMDPGAVDLDPASVPALVAPVLRQAVDFLAPRYDRHPLEGPLVTLLVRPLIRAAYGYRLQEPLAGEFSCSGRLASRCLAESSLEDRAEQLGFVLWIATRALTEGFRVCEARLAPRTLAPREDRPGLPQLFADVVGDLFGCLEQDEAFWTSRTSREEIPVFGEAAAGVVSPPALDPAPMREAFRQGVRDLEPVLAQILTPGTVDALRRFSTCESETCSFAHETWTACVYESAAAQHRQRMSRAHVVQALVPLYLGKAAAFLAEHASDDAAAVERDLETLERTYEEAKPGFVELWRSQTGGDR